MENLIDFFRGALPWITVGLALAVLCARSAKKKKEDQSSEDYGTEGMCLGTAIGTSLGNYTGIGISLGMLMGLAVGSCIKKAADSEDGDEKKK